MNKGPSSDQQKTTSNQIKSLVAIYVD